MGKIKATLDKSVKYIANGEKTDSGRLVSASWTAFEKDPAVLAEQLNSGSFLRANSPRKGSVLAYHVIQSFSPDDLVTAETAHHLGMEFAARILPGQRFVIATHTDKHHIHNHILISPVCHDGRHVRLNRKTIFNWRNISDDLCMREGLSVIEQGVIRRYGRSFGEIYSSAKGIGVKSSMRRAIDIAAQNAKDYITFAALLKTAKISVSVRGQHFVYEDKESGLRVRDSRLGMSYMQDTIMSRLGRKAVCQITFDKSMIVKTDETTITAVLPGTSRKKQICIPKRFIVESGKTFRAFLPAGEKQVITDRKNAYNSSIFTEELYKYFKKPEPLLEKMANDSWRTIPAGKTQKERAAWIRQARKLDRLRDAVRMYDAQIRYLKQPKADIDGTIEILKENIRQARIALAAQIIARDDALQNGRAEADDGLQDLEMRELLIEQMQQDLGALKKAREKTLAAPEKNNKIAASAALSERNRKNRR